MRDVKSEITNIIALKQQFIDKEFVGTVAEKLLHEKKTEFVRGALSNYTMDELLEAIAFTNKKRAK